MQELDSLLESLLEGRLGRRAFMQKALALGISPPAAGALLSAWGRGGAVAQAAVSATPKRGGVLKFACNFEPVTLGPFGAADNGTIWTIMMIYDQLVEYQPGALDPQPGLAQSWEFKNGGKTIVFHLRQANFSDGSPVTAADVQVLARPVQGPQGQQSSPVPRDEHRFDHRAERDDRRDEAEAAGRRHPRESLRVPRLDHAEGGRDQARRQGVRAEAGRQRPVHRRQVGPAASTSR